MQVEELCAPHGDVYGVLGVECQRGVCGTIWTLGELHGKARAIWFHTELQHSCHQVSLVHQRIEFRTAMVSGCLQVFLKLLHVSEVLVHVLTLSRIFKAVVGVPKVFCGDGA